jgi:hypothetical protein
MLLMLHYDVWQSAGGFDSLEKYKSNWKNKTLVNEIIESRNFNWQNWFKEIDINSLRTTIKVTCSLYKRSNFSAFGLNIW